MIGLDRLYIHRLMELLHVLMAVPMEPWTQPVPPEPRSSIALEDLAAELPAVLFKLATREHGQVLEAAQLLMTYPICLLIMVGHMWLLSARHGVIPVICLPGEWLQRTREPEPIWPENRTRLELKWTVHSSSEKTPLTPGLLLFPKAPAVFLELAGQLNL